MTKKIYSMCMAVALLVAGVAMLGCKKDNNNPDQPKQVQTYKMSIQASKGTDQQANGPRKVIGLDGTTLNATWQTGEQVTVYNATKGADLKGYLEAQSSGASVQLEGTATINTDGTAVKGIILFPDGGTFAASEFTAVGSPNTADVDFTTTCITEQWTDLQKKGCVFLPAAGSRSGTSVSFVGDGGGYWSSTSSYYSSYYAFAYGVSFEGAINLGSNVEPVSSGDRGSGRSVRLVQDAE